MKIYEVRDITSDESYYPCGYFSDREVAIGHINNPEAYSVAELSYGDGFVRLAVYELSVDSMPWDGNGKKIAENHFEEKYSEEYDSIGWEMKVVMVPVNPEKGGV